MDFATLLLVGLGGALGAACRAALISVIEKRHSHWLTTGAFFVNNLSCFIAGACLALSLADVPHAVLMVGFCGGFSTLSAVNLDAAKYLLQGGAQGKMRCSVYLVATYVFALASAVAGFAVAG